MTLLAQIKGLFSPQAVAEALKHLPPLETTIVNTLFPATREHKFPNIGLSQLEDVVGTQAVVRRDGQPIPFQGQGNDVNIFAPRPIKPSIDVAASELNDLKAIFGQTVSVQQYVSLQVDKLRRLVRTKPDGLGEIYRFVTTAEVILLEGEVSVTAPVIAETYGQASNVTAGSICEIVTSINGVDSVTNEADWLITEGADEEDDESLRHRYFLRWMSISGLNKYFYESLAMSVPGVAAVKVHDRHPRGQGTVDVYIKGAAGMPTQSLIDQVAAVIEEDKPQIDDFLVLAPMPVPVALDLVLQITDGDHDIIKAQVENRLRALFQTPSKDLGVALLKIGEDLTHSRIHYEAMKSDGLKQVIINSPVTDLHVPIGGLAVLESFTITTKAAEE